MSLLLATQPFCCLRPLGVAQSLTHPYFFGPDPGAVTNVAFHPSGNFLLSSSLDATLKVRCTCQLSPTSATHCCS